MKHYHQQRNECMLAVLAMLSGHTLWDVRLRAAKLLVHEFHYFSNWSRLVDTPTTECNLIFWECCHILCRQLGISPRIIHRYPSCRVPGSEALPDVDLSGRGTIDIEFTTTYHIVAYQNGMVFDSGQHGPLPWSKWWEMWSPHVRSYQINRLES
jgi:hypothetical protein